jgi:hypothetical protein
MFIPRAHPSKVVLSMYNIHPPKLQVSQLLINPAFDGPILSVLKA